jgi:hypothetical protein
MNRRTGNLKSPNSDCSESDDPPVLRRVSDEDHIILPCEYVFVFHKWMISSESGCVMRFRRDGPFKIVERHQITFPSEISRGGEVIFLRSKRI